jgi:hypothetical protein
LIQLDAVVAVAQTLAPVPQDKQVIGVAVAKYPVVQVVIEVEELQVALPVGQVRQDPLLR